MFYVIGKALAGILAFLSLGNAVAPGKVALNSKIPFLARVTLDVDGKKLNQTLPALFSNGQVLVSLQSVQTLLNQITNPSQPEAVQADAAADIPSVAQNLVSVSPASVPAASPSLSSLAYIKDVSVNPPQASAGQAVTFAMRGSPGGRASAIFGSEIPMYESSPGFYAGAAVIPAGMAGMKLYPVVRLRMPGGDETVKASSAPVSILPAPVFQARIQAQTQASKSPASLGPHPAAALHPASAAAALEPGLPSAAAPPPAAPGAKK